MSTESMSGNAPPLPAKHSLTSPPLSLSDGGMLMKESLLDAEYRCCCGTFHVERGAYWIAVVNIVICVLWLVPSVFLFSWTSILSIALSIFIYGGIIIAQRKQKQAWYLPYLILNAIGLVLIPIYIAVCVVMIVYMKEFFDEVMLKHAKTEDFAPYTIEQMILGSRVFAGAIIAWLVLSEVLGLWFQSVVWRAYKFMKMNNQALYEIRYA